MAARTTMTPRVARLAQPAPRSRLRRALRWSLWLAVPVMAVGVGGVIGLVYAFAKVPLPDKVPTAQAIIVQDRYGHELTTMTPEQNRREVPLKEISPAMRVAVIAAEDRHYYQHGAISYRGLLRAAWANVTRRRVAQGGSTITQQYVKNAYLDRKRTIFRKLREVIIATKLEEKYSKDQILEFYLNTIYFGRGAYGVDAAARTYFPYFKCNNQNMNCKPAWTAKNLTPAQAAFLAGAIRSPEFYSKDRNRQSALARRNVVLRSMAEQGSLTQQQAAKATAAQLGTAKEATRRGGGIASSPAPYFLEKVRQNLVDKLGAERVNLGGFRVVTTLDPRMQTAANKVVRTVLGRKGDPLVALVALDPQTGAVRAMYGGSDYRVQKYNLATDSMRQAGSTMKPFVLEQWLNKGFSVKSAFKGPAKIVVEGQPVHNFGDQAFGWVDLLQATRDSINTVYMQLIQKAGPAEVAKLAMQTGVDATLSSSEKRPSLDRLPSLALGASEVSTLQLAAAYGTWANRGVYAQPYVVEEITDLAGRRITIPGVDGRPAQKHRVKPRRVVSENVADTINYALRGVIKDGSGAKADIRRPAAGKTGTTNDFTDARFVGYTPNLVASVWMGYNDQKQKLENVHGVRNVSGGSFPAIMWHDFMTIALKGTPPLDFTPPVFDGEVLNSTTTLNSSTTATLPPTTLPPSTVPPRTNPSKRRSTTTLPVSSLPPSSSSPVPDTTTVPNQNANLAGRQRPPPSTVGG
ncbi:MAG TPA: transglycosylase domain-containing protein [Actinomycetes bacterium]|jgi:penicillin-binding protein 1A|nr:transglycosylase domain-containing protein [Actinomycetes bacterium]